MSCDETAGNTCPNGWNGNNITRENAIIDLSSVGMYDDDNIDKSLFLPVDLEILRMNYLKNDYETDDSLCGKNCDSVYQCRYNDNSNNGNICCTGMCDGTNFFFVCFCQK